VSTRKRIVESYIDGFRRSHHAQILSCLTDDVVWEIHGHAIVRAKAEFDGAIENEATPGHPTLAIDRLIDEGDSVVAVGSGSVALAAGGRLEFVFCDVFTFHGDAIGRIETYQVNSAGSSDGRRALCPPGPLRPLRLPRRGRGLPARGVEHALPLLVATLVVAHPARLALVDLAQTVLDLVGALLVVPRPRLVAA